MICSPVMNPSRSQRVHGGGGDAEFAGGLGDGDHLTIVSGRSDGCGGDLVVGAQPGDAVGGERVAGAGAPPAGGGQPSTRT